MAMTEYMTPGVYVEELAMAHRQIAGVPTATAAFLGVAGAGPFGAVAEPVRSLAEYERLCEPGGAAPELPDGNGSSVPNFLWHAVRAFFVEGGQRLVVVRLPMERRLDPAAWAAGLVELESIGEVGLVAAPGSRWRYPEHRDAADRIADLLVAHAERMRHRVALLDGGEGQSVAEVIAMRERLDSRRAALFHPWVVVADPVGGGTLALPPSAFVAGLCARTDAQRGVHQAPANEVVRLAVDLAARLTDAEQARLNPLGINCIRRFPDRGIRLWGARTLARDTAWTHLAITRFVAYLERSIETGLGWAVFEPNGEPLWAAVRQSIDHFLTSEWRSGALAGLRADAAFFVRCDRTTMTQHDVDTGRLVCLVGVAPLKPATFEILRIEVRTGGPGP